MPFFIYSSLIPTLSVDIHSSSYISSAHKKTMCTNRTEKLPFTPLSSSSKRTQRSKKHKVQVSGLTRRRSTSCEEKPGNDVEMELRNLKLYLENQSIVEENEKLRKKAHLLHQENLALMSEFQKKFPHLINRLSSTLFPFHKR